MERKRTWTDVVRTVLRDAEAELPPGLWQRLERERKIAGGGFRLRRGLWPRIAAAAAVVSLCLITEELGRHTERGFEGVDEPTLSAVEEVSEVSETNEVAGGLLAAVVPATNLAVPKRPKEAPETEKVAMEPVASEGREASDETETAAASFESGIESHRTESRTSERTAVVQGAAQGWRAAEEARGGKTTRERHKISGGLWGGGAFSGRHTTSGVMTRSGTGLPVADENGIFTMDHRLRYESCSFRHRQPLSFGLTLRREFRYGLSLESGVVYTLLASEVTPAAAVETIDQRLHFIGVPLRVNWCFFERNGFSLYIGMGGMAEKCVSARLDGCKLREPGIQWSAAAVLGAQYRLGNVVGLYFEPDLSYYFTQTDLKTARTRSPLTFTFRAGMCFWL